MRNDKVSEIRKILNQQNSSDTAPNEPDSPDADATGQDAPPAGDAEGEWQRHCEELEARMKEQKAEFLRQAAEYENSRKRLAKDMEESVKYASERLLQDIFPVLDSLEMTLSHAKPEQAGDPIVSGVQLTLKQFLQTLARHGLEEVGNAGDVFDPHLHEAIGTEASGEFESGRVTRVHRKGYRLKDRLIRAALVTVSQ